MKAALMQLNKPYQSSESGNVFLFILLGVILFGALAFVISRGFHSDTTASMSNRKAELLAVDVVDYAQRLERAVTRLQGKGVSENNISFDNTIDAGYAHTPDEPAEHDVFDPTGGGLTRQNPPSGANDGSAWHFTGNTCIAGIGTGATGCDTDSASNEELIAVLPNVNAAICTAIDKKLNIGDIPDNTGGAYSATKFTGAFTDGSEIIIGGSHNAACYSQGGNYYFYYVLIAR